MNVVLSAFDAQGRPTTKSFEGEATTLAQQAIDMTALLADFVLVSDLGTTKYSASEETASVNAVGAAANKDEGVILRFQLADGSIGNHRIPAPAKDAAGVFNYVSGGVVDINHVDIVAYVANFLAAGPFLIQGQPVTALISGYLEK